MQISKLTPKQLISREQFIRDSQYLMAKYGLDMKKKPTVPPQRLGNLPGYHHTKKRQEFQSHVFTGFHDVQIVPLAQPTEQPNKEFTVVRPPTPKKLIQPCQLTQSHHFEKPIVKNNLVRLTVRLKKQSLDMERLEEMTDKLKVRRLPDNEVEIEATIPQSQLPLFEKAFDGYTVKKHKIR